MVHAFYGKKEDMGDRLGALRSSCLLPLPACLVGTDEKTPLWTHPTGCDFARGAKLTVKEHVPDRRKLTRTQVNLLQTLWKRVEHPHQHNAQAPWPPDCEAVEALCGREASALVPVEKNRPCLIISAREWGAKEKLLNLCSMRC